MNVFSNIARFFHWLIAGLIISQYVLAKLAENAKANERILEQLALLANHKSIGITVLALAVIRLAYRFKYPPLRTVSSMSLWQHRASNASHVLLYVFLFAMPLSGWLMSSAKAYSVSWFNVFTLPDFIAPSEAWALNLHAIHHYLAEALFVVTLVHVGAALKHHFIDKDAVLTGMAGRKSYLVLLLTILISVGVFGRLFGDASDKVTSPKEMSTSSLDSLNTVTKAQAIKSDLPLWNIDYENSYIKFTGDQAGAPFTGAWQQWQANIQFDETGNQSLSSARFMVTIDTDSGFSSDEERDKTIRSDEFFDVMRFAQATYNAADFSADGDGYKSNGQLTMKGFSSPAILRFKITQENGRKILTGTASLDRLIWNIGSGDWTDTSWVGQDVTVDVRVVTVQ